MMDDDNGQSMDTDEQKQQSASTFQDSDPRKNPEITVGIIPRLVSDLFYLLYESTPADSSLEYTIRCSYVEIYLDKMTDLLLPGREESGLRIGTTALDKDEEETCILGATELCCLCPEDVYALLGRGQAIRTKAAADAGVDSTRSHAVFTLNLEQLDPVTGKMIRSRLQVVDLAGSQSRSTPKVADDPIATENNMLNASLKSFHNLVKGVLKRQQLQGEKSSDDDNTLPPDASLSKIAKVMKSSIGGKTSTVMICTGSPASYNIDDTIRAIQFSQLINQIRNKPQPAYEGYSIQSYRAQLFLSQRREGQLMRLIKLIAHESKHGKKKGREPKNPKVWEAILQIVEAEKKKDKKNGSDGKTKKKKKSDKNSSDDPGDSQDDLFISIYNEEDQQNEIQDLYCKVIELESKVRQERTAREKAESKVLDIRSELAALKSQNQALLNDKRKLEEQLTEAKNETKTVLLQRTEVEHRLRTSHFRENEAVLYLRQLRTFYFRLLKSKAAQGTGGTRDVIQDAKKRLPGVTDLEDLLDVDKMMVQSGIIESSEVGGDTLIADYHPSEEALSKSTMEAEMAEKRERELISQQMDFDESQESHVSISTNRDQTKKKTKNGLTYGQMAAYRQKLLNTPAGLLAIQKEQELEKELLDLSSKCIGLQNSVNAEKAMVEALSGRQGAMTKMKQAQEVIMLKTELERRTNDLLAIVWKMNELHLVNKTIDTKVTTREQHVNFLEEYVAEIQEDNQRLLAEQEACERRLRNENLNLRNELDEMHVNLWQLAENSDRAPIWRLSVPCTGQSIDLEGCIERRQSTGELTEEEIDGLVKVVEDSGRAEI
jgi:kinesin family protein 5